MIDSNISSRRKLVAEDKTSEPRHRCEKKSDEVAVDFDMGSLCSQLSYETSEKK